MLPVAEPDFSGKEIDYVNEALTSGWVSAGGPFVERFEHMIAEAVGRKWALATVTGSAALLVALDTARVKAGTNVRMPSMTFCAAANALCFMGATPHFTDIADGFPDISHVGGSVLDAAPSIARTSWPSWWRRSPLHGVAILSFNGNKTISTGQGGAVVGDDADLHTRARYLASNAKVRDYQVGEIGYNARMPNVLAAVGCAQMERLEEFREKKAAIMGRYETAGFPLQGSAWMALWRLPGSLDRDSVILRLANAGIEAKAFYTPLHLQTPYRGCPRDELPQTDEIWRSLLCLPCSTKLTESDQGRVIEACEQFLR